MGCFGVFGIKYEDIKEVNANGLLIG